MASIDHVVVLVLENRSFDHLLGYLQHQDPAFPRLTHGGPYTSHGYLGAPDVATSPDAKAVLPVDPDHAHDAVMEQLTAARRGPAWNPSNQGFVTSYEQKSRGLAVAKYSGLLSPVINWWIKRKQAGTQPIADRGPLVMRCHDPATVPVLSTLALEFTICTNWFASVPGETWPNRNYLHAATSDGETNINTRFYKNKTVFELLEEHDKTWRIYHDDTPQVWAFDRLWTDPDRHANWYEFSDFAQQVASDQLAHYSFIVPNHRPPLHTLDHEPVIGQPDISNNQHPGNNVVSNAAYDTFPPSAPTDFRRAEQLIASVYEALRSNPALFERTVLLVTYDEHGGLYDHVRPPAGRSNPGHTHGLGRWLLARLYHRAAKRFDFSMLGVRVPAVVISPFVERGSLSPDVRDHASVPSTLRALFAPSADPLTSREAQATPFHTLLTRAAPRQADLPDLSAHVPTTTKARTSGPVPADAAVPDYYNDLAKLSRKVGRKLRRRGTPEARVPRRAHKLDATQQVTSAFVLRAQRSRASTHPIPPSGPTPK